MQMGYSGEQLAGDFTQDMTRKPRRKHVEEGGTRKRHDEMQGMARFEGGENGHDVRMRRKGRKN